MSETKVRDRPVVAPFRPVMARKGQPAGDAYPPALGCLILTAVTAQLVNYVDELGKPATPPVVSWRVWQAQSCLASGSLTVSSRCGVSGPQMGSQ
jgi:hypothetical protein